MDKNYFTISGDIKSDEVYTIYFTINGTLNTSSCYFKTLKNDEIIRDITVTANDGGIDLNWKVGSDVSFLNHEEFKFYTLYKNRTKGCTSGVTVIQEQSMDHLAPEDINFEVVNHTLKESNLKFFNLTNDQANSECSQIEIWMCSSINVMLCKPPVKVLFNPSELLIKKENKQSEGFIAMITISSIILLLLGFAILLCCVYKPRKKKAQSDIEMKEPQALLLDFPEVTIDKKAILGKGNFGEVYIGYLRNDKTEYAVKIGEGSLQEEARLCRSFKTNHIVRFIEIFTIYKKDWLVMELMRNGDLKTFLIDNKPVSAPLCSSYTAYKTPKTVKSVAEMAIEIADGMAYLHDNDFIHNDLAARNCLVHADSTVKVGDFGMTRSLDDKNYYRIVNGKLLPLRWLAPEALSEPPVLTKASDVYSFGVVLFELVTYCDMPYAVRILLTVLNSIDKYFI